MFAFTLALLCFVFWGLGDFLAILAVRKVGAFATSVWLAIIGLLIATPYIPFAGSALAGYTALILVFNLLLGLVFVFSNVIYSYAVKDGNAAIVTSIGASFSAWTALLASWIYSEHLSLAQWSCVAVITLGLVLSTLDFSRLDTARLKLERGIYFAILATIGWTIYFTFIRIVIAQVGWFWPTFFSLLCFPAVILIEKIDGRNISLLFRREHLSLLIVAGLLVRIAEFIYNAALRHGYTALIVPVAGAYPVLIVLLSFLFLRERVSLIQLIGVGLTLFAIVTLGTTAS